MPLPRGFHQQPLN